MVDQDFLKAGTVRSLLIFDLCWLQMVLGDS